MGFRTVQMIAVKTLMVGLAVAASATLAPPTAQADDPPCTAAECQQPPRPSPSIYPRHNYACVRGVCVPLPAPRSSH